VSKKKLTFLVILLMLSSMLSGCNRIEELKVKLGVKNNDFEYIKQGKIEKIVIQNTRDKGFRFIVTDKKAIAELYDILSTAKEAQEKSTLVPDYTFEMQEGINKVYKFNYIAGLDKKDAGNLYSDNKVYIVSKRLDSDIIKSFWNVRRPRDFQKVYYEETILGSLARYKTDVEKEQKAKEVKTKLSDKKIGVNIDDDVEVGKFILSTDLEDFKGMLNNQEKNAEMMVKDKNYDIKMTVKTQGYKSTLFKAIVTFWDKQEMSEKKYYIISQIPENKNSGWRTEIFTDKDKDSLRDF